METSVEPPRRVREFRFEPEYNFDPRKAVRVVRRATLFVEAGAVTDAERIVHGWVRCWVNRERFAVALTAARRRGEPTDRTFVTPGIALQDISW